MSIVVSKVRSQEDLVVEQKEEKYRHHKQYDAYEEVFLFLFHPFVERGKIYDKIDGSYTYFLKDRSSIQKTLRVVASISIVIFSLGVIHIVSFILFRTSIGLRDYEVGALLDSDTKGSKELLEQFLEKEK